MTEAISEALLGHLQSYEQWMLPRFESELKETDFIDEFRRLATSDRSFHRDHLPGHFTGSAMVLDESCKKVLLTHHAKLHKWIQLGGHADGDPDLAAVALREAREESGIDDVRLGLYGGRVIPFDIDIHRIPESRSIPSHLHFDMRFVVIASSTSYVVSDESIDLAWFSPVAAEAANGEASMIRQLRKLKVLADEIV